MVIFLFLSIFLLFSNLSGVKEVIGTSTKGCTHKGSLDYNVILKPNILYGQTILPKGEIYFANIIDYIDSKYTYNLICNEEINGKYSFNAIIKTDQWQKNFALINDTNIEPRKGENQLLLTISQPINISYYAFVADNIDKEIGISNEKTELILDYSIDTQESFDHQIKIPLRSKTFQINDSLIKEKEETVDIEIKKINYYSIIPIILLILGLIISLFFVQKIDIEEKEEHEKDEIDKILNKYKDIIFEGIPSNIDIPIQPVKSIDDLVKIADDLIKPIIHIREDDKDILYVLDVNIKYEYIL